MHKALFKRLPTAEGESARVIAVFLDVRGFSAFEGMGESVEGALFLKKMYLAVLNDYFKDPDFFKPTGDGLMIIYQFEESELSEVAAEIVDTSCRLVEDFADLLGDDPMVNFAVPGDLGIGIARGAATCLRSGRTTLDYSGRPLNLAARLMDFARPSGVVFDASLPAEILPSDLLDRFSSDEVFIKGIADTEPRTIYYLAERTVVPESAHQPIGQYEWKHEAETMAFKRVKERGSFIHSLTHVPAFPQEVTCEVSHTKVLTSGRRSKSLRTLHAFKTDYVDNVDGPQVRVRYPTITKKLTKEGVKDDWPVRIRILYKVAPTGT